MWLLLSWGSRRFGESILLGLLLTVLPVRVRSHRCEIGQERDPQQDNKWRWVLPHADPCQCTEVVFGGMNTVTPKRHFQPIYVDKPLVSSDVVAIRRHYGIQCPDCAKPLGMEDGRIIDTQITSSSELVYHGFTWEAKYARLNGNYSWIPAIPALLNGTNSQGRNEWIQVRLAKATLVSGIITQGRPGIDRWVKAYKVFYTLDGNSWETINRTDSEIPQEFAGNVDNHTAVRQIFPNPIHMTAILINPIDWHIRVGLRFELLTIC